MVKIRLSKHGRKKKTFYHIVVADSRSPRDGRFIEKVGFFDPFKTQKNFLYFNEKRILFWKKNGAKLSNRVKLLIKKKHK